MIKKKIVAMTLCFGMLFSMSVMAWAAEANTEQAGTCFGAENEFGPVNTGVLLSSYVSIEEQLAGLSEEQREAALERLNYVDDDNHITPYAVTWTYLPYTAYKQETRYYCVPASCKAIMQYLTGSSDSQSTIAAELGTTSIGTEFDNARIYLNNHQSKFTYLRRLNMSRSRMEDDFINDINNFSVPPLICCIFVELDGWKYDAICHVLCITGARSDKEYFQVADSYIRWVSPDASMFYNKSSYDIYYAIFNEYGYIF